MKRKISVLLITLTMLAALSVPAFADVLWEPYGNAFYESHREECSYVDRTYLANGEKGYITVKTAPNSLVEVTNMVNGSSFRVVQVWQSGSGERWGVGYCGLDIEGWVAMDELALIYDYIAFEEDHAGEFLPYDGSGDQLAEVCLYSYPGGTYRYNLTENESYMPFAESFEHLYTDENGLRWTFVGYYMGRNNAWACIDDPLNEKLGTGGSLTVEQVRSSGGDHVADAPEGASAAETEQEALIPPAEKVPQPKSWVVWAVPAGLVVAAAAATAVLIRKKNKKT